MYIGEFENGSRLRQLPTSSKIVFEVPVVCEVDSSSLQDKHIT